MRGEPVLRHFDAFAETRGDHPPADDRLQRQEAGPRRETGRPTASREPPLAPEPQQRRDKGEADDARQQAMRPFPVEDRLEPAERHVRVQLAELWNLLVAREFFLPLRLVQRRNDAGDRLPFRDRQAGFGQPRRPADQHHRENERGDGEQQPYPNRARDLAPAKPCPGPRPQSAAMLSIAKLRHAPSRAGLETRPRWRRQAAPPPATNDLASQFHGEGFMPRRARKFFGGLAMLVFVVFYALIAMALAQSRPLLRKRPPCSRASATPFSGLLGFCRCCRT